MLTELRVRNFRLLRDVLLSFTAGTPIVVIGPNSSGKSTLIEVLDFLSTAVSAGLEKAAYRDRQGPSDFISAAAEGPLEIAITLSAAEGFPNAPDGGPVLYECEIASDGGYLRVISERIDVFKRGPAKKPLTVLERTGPTCRLLNADSKTWDEVEVNKGDLAITTIDQPARYPTLRNVKKALETVNTYPGFLAAPSWARDPREGSISPRESTTLARVERLDRRGFDLINALYSLQSFHAPRWAELVRHFNQEFPFVERLTFPPDPGGSRLALGWHDKRYPHVPLRIQQMSSGMVHFLCLLTAALTPGHPVLLAFDEPEAHLHPSALRRLVSILESVSDRTSVLIVTHSSQLLEFLDDPAGAVRTCEAGSEGARLEKLNKDALESWLGAYSITELRRRSLLDASNESVPELV